MHSGIPPLHVADPSGQRVFQSHLIVQSLMKNIIIARHHRLLRHRRSSLSQEVSSHRYHARHHYHYYHMHLPNLHRAS